MKIKVTMKDPDTMIDAVREAVERDVQAMGLPDDEAESLIEMRAEKEQGKLANVVPIQRIPGRGVRHRSHDRDTATRCGLTPC